jgi:transcriptional regulator with PAS, ATPase and Fis domain
MSDFHWLAFFQRSGDALFLLNRHRRLLWVNHAWEELTGMSRATARGLACRARRSAIPDDAADLALARALAPPSQVLEGRSAHVRRLVQLRDVSHRWDLEFFPFRDAQGVLGVLGKIVPLPQDEPNRPSPPLESLANLAGIVRSRYDHASLSNQPSEQAGMGRLLAQVRLASQTRVPVTIRGEPGTGKEWVARVIHHQGITRSGPFAALDCRRLPRVALAAALFEGGRLVRRAGTVYLREPACLPHDLQSVLGMWLAEAGAEAPRIICGMPPDEGSSPSALTEELATALSVLVIDVPPLRQRLSDLGWLAERMLAPPEGGTLTREALTMLLGHPWPGNLRELRQALAEARSHAPDGRIEVRHLPMYLRLGPTVTPEKDQPLPLRQLLAQAERRLIALALQRCRGKQTRAAEMLGVNRPYLRRRMEELGLATSEE